MPHRLCSLRCEVCVCVGEQTDLKLHIDIRNGTSTHLASVVLDIEHAVHNTSLSRSYTPLRRAAVIVPCYNCAATIAGTLESVVASGVFLTQQVRPVLLLLVACQ